MNRKIMETIIKNSNIIKNTVSQFKNEVQALKESYFAMKIKNLTLQNSELLQEIDALKRKLIQLETLHGKKQIPIPTLNYAADKVTNGSETKDESANNATVSEQKRSEQIPKINEQVPKEKKVKPKQDKKVVSEQELPVDVGRLDLRIGQIMEVQKHPDADSLYVSKIQCGDPALRTVVSGLVKFVPIDELQNRKVVVLCNLKPVKMRGVTSEAMVMCASSPDAVEVLTPPEDAQPGDVIDCEGFVRQPDAQLNPKKKIFETVAPDLKTNDSLQACYKGVPLIVTGKGPITTKSLVNVNVK